MSYSRQEYKKYRVSSPIKSFRDLEVYRQANLLSVEIFKIVWAVKKGKKNRYLLDEFEILYSLAKLVPKLVAESYGDRFSSLNLAVGKLEQNMRVISNIVAKIDFVVSVVEDDEIKAELIKILNKYQKQRVKINNLRRAWLKVYDAKGSFENKNRT